MCPLIKEVCRSSDQWRKDTTHIHLFTSHMTNWTLWIPLPIDGTNTLFPHVKWNSVPVLETADIFITNNDRKEFHNDDIWEQNWYVYHLFNPQKTIQILVGHVARIRQFPLTRSHLSLNRNTKTHQQPLRHPIASLLYNQKWHGVILKAPSQSYFRLDSKGIFLALSQCLSLPHTMQAENTDPHLPRPVYYVSLNAAECKLFWQYSIN